MRQKKFKHTRDQKKRKPRRFNYDGADLLSLNFRAVCEFLGELPLCRKRATTWNTFDKVFDLYWGLDNSNVKRLSGWNQKYRQAYQKTLDMMVEVDAGDQSQELSCRFKEKVRTAFEYYCPCLPATSPTRWISPNGGSHDKATWLAFRPDGTQDGYAVSPDEDPEEDSSWAWIRPSIKQDQTFYLSMHEVVTIETIEQLIAQRRIRRFPSYDGSWRELPVYQDDESAQRLATEIKNAKADRQH